MKSADVIRQEIEQAIALRQSFLSSPANIEWIDRLAQSIVKSLRSDGKVILAGNGGSFADAQHIAAEFLGRFMVERPPLAAHCLGTNSSLTTAVGNDYSFDEVFSRELTGVGQKNDTLILLTTSGNSKNIILAAKVAEEIGIGTFVLAGKGGGAVSGMCDSLIIESDHTARIQEMHITVGHIVCGLVDDLLSNVS